LESAHDALGDEIRRAVQIIQTSTNGDVVLGSPEEVAATLQSLKALKETCLYFHFIFIFSEFKILSLQLHAPYHCDYIFIYKSVSRHLLINDFLIYFWEFFQ
jgi:hypothetical protein